MRSNSDRGVNDKEGRGQIPEVVVSRLPMYLRGLTELDENGIDFVSSGKLGALFGMTPVQIRKDLSYFGKFGRRGRGYKVSALLAELKQILGLERRWLMAVVGVGRLGAAILDYKGFAPRGFQIVAAFDKDPRIVGKRVGGLVVHDIRRLEEVIKRQRISIAIVAVPASDAQHVIDKLVASGVTSILNYAPVSSRVPPGVRVEGIDPLLALQSMTYYLTRSDRRG